MTYSNVPSELQRIQFSELVDATAEPEVKKYMTKAYRAYCDGHLEAAILLSWAAVERYTVLVVNEVGRWYFDLFNKPSGKKRRHQHLPLSVLDNIAGNTRFFCNYLKDLGTFANLRHKIAHGTGTFVSDCELVLSELKNAKFILTKLVSRERLSEPYRFAGNNGLFLNENYQIDYSRIEILFLFFPEETNWNKFFTTLLDNFLEKLDRHWKDFDEVKDDAEEKNRDISEITDNYIKLQNIYFERVGVALNAVANTFEVRDYETIWESYIPKLLKHKRFKYLMIDYDEGQYRVVRAHFQVLNLIPFPEKPIASSTCEKVFEELINALQAFFDESYSVLIKFKRLAVQEQEKYKNICINLDGNLSKISENIPSKHEADFMKVQQRFNRFYNMVFPRKE